MLRLRQQGHLGAERLVVHVAAEDDLRDTTGTAVGLGQRVTGDRRSLAVVGLCRRDTCPDGDRRGSDGRHDSNALELHRRQAAANYLTAA
jgi:hypothetical protein